MALVHERAEPRGVVPAHGLGRGQRALVLGDDVPGAPEGDGLELFARAASWAEVTSRSAFTPKSFAAASHWARRSL